MNSFKLALNDRFQASQPQWYGQSFFDKYLILYAVILACIGGVLLALGGLDSVFYPVHKAAHTLFPDWVWANITFVGDTVVALVIALILIYRFPHLAMAILIAALAGTILIQGLKAFFSTPRPAALLDLTTFSVIGPVLKANSMPSGHAATGFLLVGLLSRCFSSLYVKVGLLVLGTFIGWSRVAVGAHWPADVCFGAALGLFTSWCGLQLSDRWKVNIVVYCFVAFLLLFAAILLLEEDGGFISTYYSAKVLSVFAILVFVTSWLKFYVDHKSAVNND